MSIRYCKCPKCGGLVSLYNPPAQSGGEGCKVKQIKGCLTKKEIAGDDDEAKDTGDANMEPQAQDRDIADEKIEEQQEEPVEKEVDAVEEKPTEETSKE